MAPSLHSQRKGLGLRGREFARATQLMTEGWEGPQHLEGLILFLVLSSRLGALSDCWLFPRLGCWI